MASSGFDEATRSARRSGAHDHGLCRRAHGCWRQTGSASPADDAAINTPAGEQNTQVVIQFSRAFSNHLSNHEKPPRALVEIPHGQFAKLPSHIPVNQGVVQAIDLQERGNQARVEVVLDQLGDYAVQKQDHRQRCEDFQCQELVATFSRSA